MPPIWRFAPPPRSPPFYEQLARDSVLSVKAEQLANFLGRQITPQLAQELGSQFPTRIEGTRIKYRFGKASIKMYDKFGCVLRVETTTNDVSFFKHHRKVEHRDAPSTRALDPVKKTIYSLIDLREILLSCNRRALDDFSAGVRALDRLTKSRRVEGKTVKASTSSIPSTTPCYRPSRTRGRSPLPRHAKRNYPGARMNQYPRRNRQESGYKGLTGLSCPLLSRPLF
jgi:hypothetical protein